MEVECNTYKMCIRDRPEYVEIVVGRKVKNDLAEDTILTWDMI